MWWRGRLLPETVLPRNVNAQRSDAAGSRREIDCTAGWSCAGRSWRWHQPWVAIRWSTDERRTQTAIASARVRGLLEAALRGDREWRTRAVIFIAAADPDPRRQRACARSFASSATDRRNRT